MVKTNVNYLIDTSVIYLWMQVCTCRWCERTQTHTCLQCMYPLLMVFLWCTWTSVSAICTYVCMFLCHIYYMLYVVCYVFGNTYVNDREYRWREGVVKVNGEGYMYYYISWWYDGVNFSIVIVDKPFLQILLQLLQITQPRVWGSPMTLMHAAWQLVLHLKVHTHTHRKRKQIT